MVSRSEIGTPTQRGLLRDCTTGCGTDGSICGTNNYVPFSDPWLRCPRWAERCQWRRHLLSLPGFLLLITLAPAPAQTITAALQHICTTHQRRSCGQNILCWLVNGSLRMHYTARKLIFVGYAMESILSTAFL